MAFRISAIWIVAINQDKAYGFTTKNAACLHALQLEAVHGYLPTVLKSPVADPGVSVPIPEKEVRKYSLPL